MFIKKNSVKLFFYKIKKIVLAYLTRSQKVELSSKKDTAIADPYSIKILI